MSSKTVAFFGLLSFMLIAFSAAAKDEPPQTSHDGLELRPGTKAALVYLRPGADFAVYDKVALLDCKVAFQKNWQREQNQSRPLAVSKKDMDQIRAKLAELFTTVFSEELTKGGYQIVAATTPDVLLIAPAIIDLDIAAPASVQSAGRSKTFSTSAGQMTLVLEMYDSTTGEIIARAADRKAGRDSSAMQWQNAATNRSEATRILRTWAVALREALDNLRRAPTAQ